MDVPMSGSGTPGPVTSTVKAGAGAAGAAATALWGASSLGERFGGLSGRELQEHLFEMYQAPLSLSGCRVVGMSPDSDSDSSLPDF